MIKRIYLPTTVFTEAWLLQKAEWDIEAKAKLEKKATFFNEQVKKAEAAMDTALNEGFEYVTQYASKGESEEGVTFIFHKRDKSRDTTRGAGMPRLGHDTDGE